VDRHQVLADLKLAELKMLCLYQEYKQLQTFEAKDLALQQRQRRCEGEKNEIAFNMADQKQKLDARMEDMKGWVEKLSSITAELKAALPDSNPFAEILNKIYKKKIKRNKAGADGEEEEEEEEEEDGDDDDEEEEVEDICPIGCDRLLYDRILELRDRRTEVDEMIAEIQKSIDDLKKTTDRLKQREKQILKDAVQAELDTAGVRSRCAGLPRVSCPEGRRRRAGRRRRPRAWAACR
jgi:DNA repair exonuclease SbcCD ATPase subunit